MPAGRVIIDEKAIRQRVAELGAELTEDYHGRVPLFVGVLKGAFVFMADLVRAVDLDCEVDFMAVSSYGSSTRTSGVVRIVKDLDIDLAGRDVVVVEDIVDSGLTLSYLQRNLQSRNPASLAVCALMARDSADTAGLRYVGFRIPDDFVVGYGLDLAERHRNLTDVCVWDDELGAGGPEGAAR